MPPSQKLLTQPVGFSSCFFMFKNNLSPCLLGFIEVSRIYSIYEIFILWNALRIISVYSCYWCIEQQAIVSLRLSEGCWQWKNMEVVMGSCGRGCLESELVLSATEATESLCQLHHSYTDIERNSTDMVRYGHLEFWKVCQSLSVFHHTDNNLCGIVFNLHWIVVEKL